MGAGYATSLLGPFQFDDYVAIVRHPPATSVSAWWDALGTGLRPVLKLTYALDSSTGLGPAEFHAVNALVHLVNACLVLALFRASAVAGRAGDPLRAVTPGALLAAALFAVHPIQTDAVTYISGRSSSLSATFYLSAVLLHARARRSGGGWRAAALPLVAFMLAVLTKETTATLPLAILLWDVVVERPGARGVLLRQLPWWALLVPVLLAAVMQQRYFGLLHHVIGAKSLAASFASQLDGVGYLVTRLVLVNRLSIDPGLGFVPPAPFLRAVGAVALATAGGVAALAWRRDRTIALGCLWLVLHLVLPYALLPRDDVVNERHAYLASAGMFFAVGATWDRLAAAVPPRRVLGGTAALVVALLTAQTARRGLDYRSPVALWESTVRASPANPRARFNLGLSYEGEGRFPEARAEYRRALDLEPRYERPRRRLERLGQ